MTTPSRTSEIRRRRTRQAKVALLRRRYAKATTEGERKHIVSKLERISAGITVEQFLEPLQREKPKQG